VFRFIPSIKRIEISGPAGTIQAAGFEHPAYLYSEELELRGCEGHAAEHVGVTAAEEDISLPSFVVLLPKTGQALRMFAFTRSINSGVTSRMPCSLACSAAF